MSSTIDRRPIAPPNDRRARNALVMIGVGVILLFAVLGVVSAGIFVGGKISGSSSPTAKHHTSTGSAVAVQDLARAHAQATQIVATAQQSGKALVKRQVLGARRQAAAIVSAARRRAAALAASAPAASSSATGAGTSSQQAAGTSASSSTTAPSATGYGSTSPTTATGSPPSASANLSGLPASWLVVAYNATFGSGPGSVGSITVTNRSSKTFGGTAEVAYTGGGAATAPFSGLAPGQTVVLPLNGPAYPGRGFTIRVVNPH